MADLPLGSYLFETGQTVLQGPFIHKTRWCGKSVLNDEGPLARIAPRIREKQSFSHMETGVFPYPQFVSVDRDGLKR